VLESRGKKRLEKGFDVRAWSRAREVGKKGDHPGEHEAAKLK
jgi:hypothetical protein